MQEKLKKMNVIESEDPLRVIAKTCGWREKGK